MKQLLFVSVILALLQNASAQVDRRGLSSRSPMGRSYALDTYFTKPVQLIDMPTASILRASEMKGSLRLYENGGMLAKLSVGLSSKMMFGVSYGGENIIGSEAIRWNPMPGVHFAYRIFEESLVIPAVVLGFDNQGYGRYWRSSDYDIYSEAYATGEVDPAKHMLHRYSIKSRGVYLVASKGYESLWKVGLHAGLNYSLERSDKNSAPTVFLGMDMQFTSDLCAVGEFDFALNDNKLPEANSSRGYLNAGVRWAFKEFMYLEFDMKNLLSDNYGTRHFVRILRIVYFAKIM
jgi:hypothetical protein